MRRALLWAALVWLAGAFPLGAEPKTTIQFKYYFIYPRSPQDLAPELDARSPIIFQGQKYRGYTQWRVSWRFYWQEAPDSCRLTRVNTYLEVIYTLPQIPPSHRTTPETRQRFNRYFQALFKHEENHKNSGLDGARDIERTLLTLAPAKTCSQLETLANQTAQAIIEKYRRRDREYDQRTERGRREGVTLD